MFKKSFIITLLSIVLLFILSSISFAAFKNQTIGTRINDEELQNKIEEVQGNIPQEVKDEAVNIVFQTAYKILNKGLSQGLIIIEQVKEEVTNATNENLNEVMTDLILEEISTLEDFLNEQMEALNSASSLSDLKKIQEDLVVKFQETVLVFQSFIVENSELIMEKADEAVSKIAEQCEVDTTEISAKITELKTKIEEIKTNFENNETDKEAIKEKLQSLDPADLQSQIQELQVEIKNLAEQCAQ